MFYICRYEFQDLIINGLKFTKCKYTFEILKIWNVWKNWSVRTIIIRQICCMLNTISYYTYFFSRFQSLAMLVYWMLYSAKTNSDFTYALTTLQFRVLTFNNYPHTYFDWYTQFILVFILNLRDCTFHNVLSFAIIFNLICIFFSIVYYAYRYLKQKWRHNYNPGHIHPSQLPYKQIFWILLSLRLKKYECI